MDVAVGEGQIQTPENPARQQPDERWRTAFENSAIGIMMADFSGRLFAANSAFLNLLGYAESELYTLAFTDITCEEDRQENVELVRELTVGMRQHFEIEKQYRRKDGTFVWVRTNVALVPGVGGVEPFWFGIVEDITERRRAEEESQAFRTELTDELGAMTRLHELSTRLLRISEFVPLLEEVLDATMIQQNADFGNIQLYNPLTKNLEIVAQRGFKRDFLEYFQNVHDSGAVCGRAMKLRNRVIVEDVSTDPAFAPHRAIAASAGFRAVQSTPLFNRSGEFLGMVSTHFRRPHRPSLRDLRFTDLYAGFAAEIIERRRLEQARREIEKQAEEMQTQQLRQSAVRADVSVAFGKEETLNVILRDCAETFVLHLDAAFAGIWTFHQTGNLLELQASAGIYTHVDGIKRRVPVGKTAVGIIARERKPFLTNDVLKDPRLSDTAWARSAGILGFAGCPLVVGERTLGVVAMFSRKFISIGTLETLAFAADLIAQGIERHLAETRLRESERSLRELTETIPQMLWSADPEGAVDYCNRRVLDYTGLSAEQVHGTGWITTVHQDDVEKLVQAWMVAVSSGAPFQYECRCLRAADQAYRWCISSALPLRGPNEQIIKWFGTVVDLQDWKQAQIALQTTQAELARVSRVTTMGELAASIAHEVNQPLTAVTNNASACLRLLAEQNLEPGVLRKVLGEIVSDSTRASAVIARIRAFIKKTPAERHELDLNEVIQEVLALTSHELHENRVVLECEMAKLLPHVRGDRVQLQQVLLNLIMNGMEAMTGVTDRPRLLRVQTGMDESGSVLVTVCDSGSGLGPRAGLVFAPFFTTKASGMGMGLSISRSLVEAHGGKLWTTPDPPHGTVFLFTLPIADGSFS